MYAVVKAKVLSLVALFQKLQARTMLQLILDFLVENSVKNKLFSDIIQK